MQRIERLKRAFVFTLFPTVWRHITWAEGEIISFRAKNGSAIRHSGTVIPNKKDCGWSDLEPHQRIREPNIGYADVEDRPARSPDLTSLDFFQLGYLKQQIYANPQQILSDLK